MTAPAPWEAWLAEEFPAYLLACSRGQPRPGYAIDRALRHLDACDLGTLASLAFLLGGERDLEHFLTDGVPRYLRRLYPRTERHHHQHRGHIRGRVDWGRTLVLRQQSFDPTLTVTTSLHRTFDTPELRLLRWLIARIHSTAADLGPGAYARDTTWVAQIRRIHQAAEEHLRHAALRDLPDERPTPHSLAACDRRDPLIRRAHQLALEYLRLHPLRDPSVLVGLLESYALVPLDDDTRFELYALLTLIAAVDRALPGATRKNTLIRPQRRAIATWSAPPLTLRLFYNQSARPGLYQRALAHHYDLKATLRPDLRLVLRDARAPDHRVELLLDAKRSISPAYLRLAYLKMHGYLADRPTAFHPAINPKAIILALRPLLRPPSPTDPVLFLDPSSTQPGAPLDTLIHHWLTAATAPLPAGHPDEAS